LEKTVPIQNYMIILETERLRITPTGDVKLFLAEMKKSHLSQQFEIYRHVPTFELRDEQIAFSISSKATREFLGGLSLHGIDQKIGKFEIGYWLKADQAGKGYASEAVAGMTRLLFENYNAQKLEIRCDSRNAPSMALAERLGFLPEAIWNGKNIYSGEPCQSLSFARYDAKNLPYEKGSAPS
jgi:RimJ/RimL family protein N-acetyltransferase